MCVTFRKSCLVTFGHTKVSGFTRLEVLEAAVLTAKWLLPFCRMLPNK